MCFNNKIFGWLLIKIELFWSTLLLTMNIGVENKNMSLNFSIANMFLRNLDEMDCMNGKCNITSSLRSSICHD